MIRIVSTDVGLDDALALVFLHRLGPPVQHVIATGGNVPARQVLANCAWLSRTFGLGGQLLCGSDPPGPPVDAAEVHGPHGLAKIEAPPSEAPPLSALLEALTPDEEPVEILVLGPATDAARLLEHSDLARRIHRVVVMGGAFETSGNVTPHAEFNFYADPGAADAVLQWEGPVDCVPLDATESRLFTEQELLDGVPQGPRGDFIRRAVRHLRAAQRELAQGDGVFMHDVVAAGCWAGLLQARWRESRVSGVVAQGPRRGQVRRGVTGRPVRYAVGFGGARFLQLWRRAVTGLT